MAIIRAIDGAMSEERPAKRYIRDLWTKRTKDIANETAAMEVPLYLTLSGASGLDLVALIKEGIIKTTEVGSISSECQSKFGAIERNSSAIAELQRRFPGLKIFGQPIESLVRGSKLTAYPNGEHERWCRARVINLDFDSSLGISEEDGEPQFPILTWIRKLAQLHANSPRIEWCLFLTLNSTIQWSKQVNDGVRSFLTSNFQKIDEFRERAKTILGEELFKLLAQEAINFATLPPTQQQKILMLFVPKKIAQLVRDQGWRIQTHCNLRYGGDDGEAPMVTWILCFEYDEAAIHDPDTVYRASVNSSVLKAGFVGQDGLVVEE